jgi:VWFA-related protein
VRVLVVASLLGSVGMLAEDRFSDQIEVTEVEVPVRVLVKGKPLSGLQQEDFVLYDEGERQTIVGFRESRGAIETQPAAIAESAGLDDAPPGRRLLLLFDFSHSRSQRLANALRGIRSSLSRQLQPDDRVAVATYGYVSGINLLVGFTTDTQKLDLAFDAIQAMLGARGKKQRELLEQLHRLRFGGDDAAASSSTFQSLADELGAAAALAVLTGPVVYDEEVDDGVQVEEQESVWKPIKVRVEVDVREPVAVAQDIIGTDVDTSAIRAFGLALAELTTLLRDVGGQKDMVLISEGFSGALLENARSMFYLQKAFQAFRDSGWTLHAVDVGGIPGLGEARFASNSLVFMADATGGDLVENINDFSLATNKVLQRTSVVYTLTFQPTGESEPGEFRKLRVELKNPPKGVEILHRPGYYSARPPSKGDVFQRRMDGVGWLMTNLEASDLAVDVYAKTETDLAGDTRVPVAVEVPAKTLRSIKTGKPTRLELQLAVIDESSDVREILNGEVKIKFSDLGDVLSGGGVRFVGDLGLTPGDYRMRVLVRSSRQGEVYLGTFPLAVGPGAENTLPLPPPELERQGGGWLTVEAEKRTAYFQ